MLNEYMIEVVQQYDMMVDYNVVDHTYDMIFQGYLTYFKIWEREKNILFIMQRCGKLHYLYEIIEKSIINNNSEYIISKIKTVDNFKEYYYAWLSGALTSVLIQWVKSGCDHSPEQLSEIILTLFKSTSYNFWHK